MTKSLEIRRGVFTLKLAIFALMTLLTGAIAQAETVQYTIEPASGRVTRADYPDGSFIVYGYDANGNRTSATVTRPADTQAPTAPAGLTATVVSATRIDLAWTASSDNRGVTNYRVERCQGVGCGSFSEIAQPTAVSFQNTGLTNGVSYSYRVRAADAAGNLSGYSNTATKNTDTTPPTTPGTPTFSAITATSATASFTGSTDNVGVTGYQYRLNGGTWVTTGAGTATSFTITGLTASTTYAVAIRARDAAPNFSVSSGNGTLTTTSGTDTTPPTTPGTPTFSAITATSATASFTGSTDNVGVTGYQYRLNGGTWVTTGAGTATSFTITGLTASTTYAVAIRARDAAPNFSVSSGNGTLTTTSGADTTPPTTPGTPTFSAITATSATASFTGSTDNVGVTGYQYRLNGGTWVTTGAGTATSFTITGLTASTTYAVAIRARDAAPNFSVSSGNGTLTTTSGTDTTPPTTPGTPTFSAITATSATASFTGSTDNVGVTGYQYRLNGGTWVTTGAGTATSFTITGLTASTTYAVAIRARDAAPNFSVSSGNGTLTTTAGTDTTPPTTPGTPTFSSITATSATASWTASTDAVGVTGYQYSLNGGAWTNTGSASPSFGITGLTNGTNYTFGVRARDAAGNFSAASANGSFSTPDNAAPSTPGTPGFSSVTATSATASWTAASDNVGVTGYEYSLSGGPWTATGSSSPGVGLSGLSGSTTYTLAVRARDAAGNFSGASGTGSFTTLDNSPPTTPGTPGFSGISSTAASASWSASSDNIGVTGYEYSLNGGAWSSTGSASPGLALSGLSPSTNYSLAVRARDAAGNLSGASGNGSFTTPAPPDTTAPSAPGAPGFSAVTHNSATVSWGAASDNVGVTSYEYSIDGGSSWSSAGGALTVNLTGLAVATTYNVQVRAKDAANNTGPASSGSLTTIAQITLASRTVTVHTQPGSPTAVYLLHAMGDIWASPPSSIPPVDTGSDWLAPKVGMSSFQAMATVTGGTCSTGSYGTWLNISAGPSWSRSGIGTCVFNLQIRHSANPSVILATAQITLTGN